MRSRLVDADKLIPLLDELSDPNSARNHATEAVIDAGRNLRRSPFFNGPTIVEDILFPPCVRLGVAVRIIEIANGIGERDVRVVGFSEEIGTAVLNGYFPDEALRPEAIYWEQIMPSYVSLGYFATTS
jgi:hypothetical protein